MCVSLVVEFNFSHVIHHELGSFNLEKRSIQGELLPVFQCVTGVIRKTEKDFLLGPKVAGQGAKVLNRKRIDLDWL